MAGTKMSEQEYRGLAGLNFSTLKEIKKSPQHFQYRLNNPLKETDYFLFGRGFHCLVLEGTEAFNQRFSVAPKMDRRTKTGKMQWAEFQERSEGKTIIKQDDFLVMTEMCAAVKANEVAAPLLVGDAEVTFKWKMGDVDLKSRVDLINYPKKRVVDLKTTQRADRKGFERSLVDYDYYVQGAMYFDAALKDGADVKEYWFVAVEKEPPYGIGCYKLSQESINVGRDKYEGWIQTYLSCLNRNQWKSYESAEIGLPEWAKW